MINIKTPQQIDDAAESSAIVAEVLQKLKESIKPGINTAELDSIAKQTAKSRNGRCAFLGYRDFPGAICASVNNEVVHGIPSENRVLKQGDIISIDFGIEKNGFFGDAAITVPVGEVSETAKRLILVTEEALYKGIEKAVPRGRLGDISAAVQKHVEASGFSVVRDFVGHGIGRNLHEEPMVPNFGAAGAGPELKSGMMIAVEPMVNEKGYEVEVLRDNWTVVTKDAGLSAHFEHTLAITENGPRILTKI